MPLGEHPGLTARGGPKTGTERDVLGNESRIRGFATPATYTVKGKQYVAIAAGGGGKMGAASGDAYVAFTLP